MSKECDWIESRLLSDDPSIVEAVDAHVASCSSCQEQLANNGEADTLLAACFASRMARAEARPVGQARRLLAMGAAVAAFVLLVYIGISSTPFGSPTADSTTATEVDPSGAAAPILAKPADDTDAVTSAAGDGATAPPADMSFYAVDAAGYAYTLSDVRGSVVVLGVFSQRGTSRRDIGRLYDAVPIGDGLQFIAVAQDQAVPETAQSLPFMVNRGSTLLGTEAGEFAIVTRDGTVHRRGLLSDVRLEETILTALAELDIAGLE